MDAGAALGVPPAHITSLGMEMRDQVCVFGTPGPSTHSGYFLHPDIGQGGMECGVEIITCRNGEHQRTAQERWWGQWDSLGTEPCPPTAQLLHLQDTPELFHFV